MREASSQNGGKAEKGSKNGGVRLTYGPLAHLLKNRMYLGEIGHKGNWFAGEHKPIIDRATFDRVQEIMQTNAISRRHKRAESGALLAGLLYDDRGNRMTPTFTTKRGVRYRFYVSAALLKGHKEEAGTLPRISGPDLEAVVITTLRSGTGPHSPVDALNDQDTIAKFIERVEVSQNNIRLALKRSDGLGASPVDALSESAEINLLDQNLHVDIAWQGKTSGPTTEVEQSSEESSESDRTLVQAIARAHAWIKLLIDGVHTSIESLAASIRMHPKVVRRSIRLAFLAPRITEAILFGQYSKSSLTLTRLHDGLSLSWIAQMRHFKMRD